MALHVLCSQPEDPCVITVPASSSEEGQYSRCCQSSSIISLLLLLQCSPTTQQVLAFMSLPEVFALACVCDRPEVPGISCQPGSWCMKIIGLCPLERANSECHALHCSPESSSRVELHARSCS